MIRQQLRYLGKGWPGSAAMSLTVVFQPIVDVTTGTVLGYEALGRVVGREADGFAPVLEWARHSHVPRFEEELFQLAVDMGRKRPRGTLLFVNIGQNLARWLVESVLRQEVRVDDLVLEITETDTNVDVWNALLAPLRSAGAKIALDDYGVGVEDLARLVKLRPEYVKLAGSVLGLAGQSTFADRTLDALIHQANISGFTLIVEQVEDVPVLKRLRRAGIRYAQGFLLGRPGGRWRRRVALPSPSPVGLTDRSRQEWARAAGVGEQDLALLAADRALLQSAVDSVMQDFPAWLSTTPAHATVELHSSFPHHAELIRTHLLQLLQGTLDDDHDAASRRVAETHLRLNVDLPWYALAYGWLQKELLRELRERKAFHLADSVLRIMTYQQAVFLATYQQHLDYDFLTNVLNRRAFMSRAEAALLRAIREGTRMAFVLVDLDGFKQINDRQGHLAGDEVLRTVGATLRSRIGPGRLVGRIGGDEFALLLPYKTDSGLRRIVHGFMDGIARSYPGLHATWGSAVLGVDGHTLDELYGHADAVLYQKRAAVGTSAASAREALVEQFVNGP
jgi:diguanylate cyclase (GGDEF)-like protein